MQKIAASARWPLFDVSQTRQIESWATYQLPPNTLMQRAGLAVARLALAIAPHARQIWIACGPGNNGGDGMEAAIHLKRWGKSPWVTWLGHPDKCPADAANALKRLQQEGIAIEAAPPVHADLCIDALLGIGAARREPAPALASTITEINARAAVTLAVDVPTGLDANSGQSSSVQVQADHTVSLLTLKPGLFTAYGRDSAGTVWLDTLGVDAAHLKGITPCAWLAGKTLPLPRSHASHKGTYGDVAVIGGAAGMTGAALLAASGALHAGCGRVFVGLLDETLKSVNTVEPEIMFRPLDAIELERMVCVFGCGGGHLPDALIERVLSSPSPVVLDADAINAIANDTTLQTRLAARDQRGNGTVLTPHPLEAARLTGSTTQQIQTNRLAAAESLCQRFACTVVLKGSGTVICSPGQTPVINLSGNGRLATAGSGDVLAGMVGALLARGLPPLQAACQAVYHHGTLADQWPRHTALTASTLARAVSFDP